MLNMILTAATDTGTGWTTIALNVGLIVVVVVAFYFMLIRPQKKQEKEAAAMRDSLSVGDEITTIGGIVGRILIISDDTVVIGTSSDKTMIRILKSAISKVDRKVGEDPQK